MGSPLSLGTNLEDAKLEEALLAQHGDDLRAMMKLLPIGKPHPTRKADMAAAIMGHLAGDPLRDVWEDLDEVQRLAVAEAVHDPDRRFRQDRFQAKYDRLPKGLKDVGYRESSPLRLFLYGITRYNETPGVVPIDLAARLRSFVSKPPEVEVASTTELAASFRQARRGYVRPGQPVPFDQVELQGAMRSRPPCARC